MFEHYLLVLINKQITMVNSADFAKRLGEILDYYGITAAAFSDMLAVNRSTISHLLSGRNKPSLEFVLKVLNQFPEVELYWLLNGQGHFPTQQKNTLPENTAAAKIPDERSKTVLHEVSVNASNEITDDFGPIERIVVFYENGKFKTYTP